MNIRKEAMPGTYSIASFRFMFDFGKEPYSDMLIDSTISIFLFLAESIKLTIKDVTNESAIQNTYVYQNT